MLHCKNGFCIGGKLNFVIVTDILPRDVATDASFEAMAGKGLFGTGNQSP